MNFFATFQIHNIHSDLWFSFSISIKTNIYCCFFFVELSMRNVRYAFQMICVRWVDIKCQCVENRISIARCETLPTVWKSLQNTFHPATAYKQVYKKLMWRLFFFFFIFHHPKWRQLATNERDNPIGLCTNQMHECVI